MNSVLEFAKRSHLERRERGQLDARSKFDATVGVFVASRDQPKKNNVDEIYKC